jgi:hypothetical protein
MNRLLVAKLFILGAVAVLLAQTAMAGTVTVQNTGTSPGMTLGVNLPWIPYSGGAYVGVENLLVDGVAYDAFCIDLYHFASGSPLLYTVDSLASSPTAVPPDAMGNEMADFIREMWAYGFANALTGNQQAADFQIAIWGVLMGTISGGTVTSDFTWLTSGSTVGAQALIDWTNTHNGALANLVGLNQVGGAQAYVIEVVPDGGITCVLLGLGLLGLAAARRKLGI